MKETFPVDQQTSDVLKAIINASDEKPVWSDLWQKVQEYKSAQEDIKIANKSSLSVKEFTDSLELSYCKKTNGVFSCGLRVNYVPESKRERNLYRQYHAAHHTRNHWRDPYSTYYSLVQYGCDERCMGTLFTPEERYCKIKKKTNLLIQYECGLIIPKYLTTMQNDVLAREHQSYHKDNQPNRNYWLESTYYLRELAKEKSIGSVDRILDIGE